MNMKEIQQVMENNQMMSLYEYLGRAAGSELGKRVAEAAMMHGVAITEREVETRTYSGKILMYPRQFLDAYFNNKLPKPINVIEL
jgi:predicted Zn-dependent protease with MMP-like domain